jgi:hypothetical protein
MLPDIRAITVCVDYDDLLAVTLPRAITHFQHVTVVTAPKDEATQALVEGTPRADCFVTDAFYRHGAWFNKGLALEEGFDFMGREGWIVVMDADIILPVNFKDEHVHPGHLYCPRRRVLRDLTQWNPSLQWRTCPHAGDKEFAGYFQLFHASDPVLCDLPWYAVRWKHAGGCDSEFQKKWRPKRKRWLKTEVLHIGEIFTNWRGRVQPRLDGQPVRGAEERRKQQRAMLAARKKHGYKKEWL